MDNIIMFLLFALFVYLAFRQLYRMSQTEPGSYDNHREPRYDDPDIDSRGTFGRSGGARGGREKERTPYYDDPDIDSRGTFGRSGGAEERERDRIKEAQRGGGPKRDREFAKQQRDGGPKQERSRSVKQPSSGGPKRERDFAAQPKEEPRTRQQVPRTESSRQDDDDVESRGSFGPSKR